jgi:hypothetical protein
MSGASIVKFIRVTRTIFRLDGICDAHERGYQRMTLRDIRKAKLDLIDFVHACEQAGAKETDIVRVWSSRMELDVTDAVA